MSLPISEANWWSAAVWPGAFLALPLPTDTITLLGKMDKWNGNYLWFYFLNKSLEDGCTVFKGHFLLLPGTTLAQKSENIPSCNARVVCLLTSLGTFIMLSPSFGQRVCWHIPGTTPHTLAILLLALHKQLWEVQHRMTSFCLTSGLCLFNGGGWLLQYYWYHLRKGQESVSSII